MTDPSGKQPRLVFSGKRNGAWLMSLVNPAAAAEVVGSDTITAFLRCFVAIDRLLTFEQLLVLNFCHVGIDTTAGNRNLHVLSLLQGSTVHEIAKALQNLCASKVALKMNDRGAWTPLDAIRRRWQNHEVGTELRNQAGHHLGNPAVYRKGFSELVKKPDITLAFADTIERRGSMFAAAWDALYLGLKMDDAGLRAYLPEMTAAARDIPALLMAAFVEVLRSNGILVDDRRTEDRERRSANGGSKPTKKRPAPATHRRR